MSKERGMIFNGEMVRAILDGRKTQTRRVIQSAARTMQARGLEVISHRAPGDKWYGDYVFSMRDRNGVWHDFTNEQFLAKCPFGQPGDRIWVRETWAEAGAGAPDLKLYRANYPAHVPTHYENVPPAEDVRWTPSIHMPRWASRITLEITGVRVEQLKSISEDEARSEGVARLREGFWKHYQPGWTQHQLSARGAFATLWDSIYGSGEWDRNPWVWVIEFKRIEGDLHATD
ncbi:hypothetical protein [Enterobacter asburiae]|uniref:Morphogenetic protein n=1 Tax=Enterobacter asburiae TaxID=61645 RepID=A0AB36FD37_ENTAS|nr:hypothetical protein [Enterobacter asburiae]MCM7466445.1 hypothetical protein [Enterobacter hormaechei]CZY38579.1 Uncharacterised protein [Enterobacter cloacae]KVJ12814.1 hypothetical protein AWS40_20300 [Enterobacter asburiae]OEH12767.1 hypothetical protein AN696_0220515 [Enterobacter asburiae]UWA73798.1 hypothetical protein M5T12_18315 [Enterobacter asburiae]